jgi:hypothetical protein
MLRLPVSGMPVRFRAMTGVQERDVWAARGDTGAAVIARLLVSLCDSVAVSEWLSVPVTDADVALLAWRQAWVGDRIETTVRCPFEDCTAPADVDFTISDFLAFRQPVLPRGVACDAGVFRYQGIAFRVPTLADEEAARTSAAPVRALAERCIETTTPRDIRKVERMLERIAPSMVSELTLQCPACGRNHMATFDPRTFVLKELSDQAQFLWDDVHVLASTYHWSKEEILTLDRATRVQLAELVRSDRAAGG